MTARKATEPGVARVQARQRRAVISAPGRDRDLPAVQTARTRARRAVPEMAAEAAQAKVPARAGAFYAYQARARVRAVGDGSARSRGAVVV